MDEEQRDEGDREMERLPPGGEKKGRELPIDRPLERKGERTDEPPPM